MARSFLRIGDSPAFPRIGVDCFGSIPFARFAEPANRAGAAHDSQADHVPCCPQAASARKLDWTLASSNALDNRAKSSRPRRRRHAGERKRSQGVVFAASVPKQSHLLRLHQPASLRLLERAGHATHAGVSQPYGRSILPLGNPAQAS